MTNPQNYKFHSTNQFRNVCKTIKDSASFGGIDESGEVIKLTNYIAPTVEFTGTVKLHGTNASIILHEDGTISFHSKSNLLGYIKEGEFTLLSDNFEFAQTMWRRKEAIEALCWQVWGASVEVYGKSVFPMKISGEWCGQGIQKGVGISFIDKKSFFIFGIKLGETDQQSKQGWLPLGMMDMWIGEHEPLNKHNIYSITDFTTYKVTIDFNNPQMVQNQLVDITNKVEQECPVSKQLGVTESLLGEGVVWIPTSSEYCWDNGNWFKVKGEKHSVSKVKKLASVNPEKLESIEKFVEYAVTDNRLEQGLQEVGLGQKLVGTFIGWINKDINKEESDTLEVNNLTMKDVGKRCSDVARKFYIDKLNNQL